MSATTIYIIGMLVMLAIEILFYVSVFYNTGWYLFRKIKIFRLTNEEMFIDATSEEFISWKKLERIALILYTLIWALFIIGVLIGMAYWVLDLIFLYHRDIEAHERLSQYNYLGGNYVQFVSFCGMLIVLVAVFFERAATLFGEKVGIDWPGRVEEVHDITPAPDLAEEMSKGMPTFGPKKEELIIIETPIQDKTYLLAIDPGLSKCGLAVLDSDGQIAARAWCKRNRLEHFMKDFVDQYKPSKIALGDGTGSAEIVKLAENQLPGKVNLVKEKGTTYEARELFISESSQRGFSMWLIKKLRGNPVDLNAWAAVVIGRRFIGVK
jgi:RNase H-fold protein (predicted Holliday junction resolvase)